MIVKCLKILFLFFVLLLVGGCLSNASDQVRGDKKTVFHYNDIGALSSLDPAFGGIQSNTWALSQLYNGLVEFDENLMIKPSIAESWSISNDGRVYSFKIRKGVFFHDHELFEQGSGREVTPADFVYSFKRICDTTKGFNQGMWIFKDKLLRNRSGFLSDTAFKDSGDGVFTVYLRQPCPHFMGILAMNYANVIPKEVAEHYGKEFRRNPVGTGPFMFHYWDEGQGLIFHKNPKYWKKDSSGVRLPYLDAVHIHFLSDKKQEYKAFLQGQLDFSSGMEPNSVDEIFNVDGTISKSFADRYDAEKIPYLNTEYLGFQCDKEAKCYKDCPSHPFLNKQFRQALNYAIDKNKLIKYQRNNVGVAAVHGMVPPFLPGYRASKVIGYDFNPDKALRLLKSSGVEKKDLEGLSVSCTQQYKELIEFVSKQWEDILGVYVKVEITGPSVYYKLIKDGEVPFFRASWLGDYPDAENYLTLFYSRNFAPSGPNKTHFSNGSYDHFYEKAVRTMDNESRNALYLRADQVTIDHSPVVPLFYDEVIRLKQKNIKGFPANAMNQLILEKVKKE